MRDSMVCLSVLYIFFFLVCVCLSKWIRVSQRSVCVSFTLFSLSLSILAYYVIPPYGWDLRRHFDLLEGIRNSRLSLREFLFQTKTNVGGSAYTSLVAFNFIRYFIARLTDNNHVLPWLCVLIDYLIISYIATDWAAENLRDGKVDFFSMMLCFSFYPFVHAVSGMRTTLSVAIMGLGIYRYLYKKKSIYGFLVLAVIAVTIHQVTLIAVPFVFLARFRIGVKGIVFVFLVSVLLERIMTFFSASGFRYLTRIAWLYVRYTSDNQYRAGRYNLYGDIILMSICVISYLLFQKDENQIFLSQKHNELYSFLIYYMCFVLGNIGNYDLVLRPSYLLGVFAPVLSFIFGNVIGVSDFVCSIWSQTSRFHQNIYSVRNAIMPEKFCRPGHLEDRKNLREVYGIREADCLLLFCGRIIPIKGVLELVRAVNQLHMEHIKLLIVGGADFSSNAQTDYVKQVMKELTGQIVMAGYVSHDKIAGYYAAADIFIQPSICEEAAPLVLLEAQASGLPVIMSDSGGGPEFVTDETAIIVEKKNAGSDQEEAVQFSVRLARAIEYLANHPERRRMMGEAAQAHAGKFNMERYLEEFVTIFEEMEG